MFPMRQNIIVHPGLNVSDEKKSELKKRLENLRDFLLHSLPRGNVCTWNFDQFLEKLNMTENEYMETVQFSVKRTTVFLGRMPSEVAVNAYNPYVLLLWKANMDIQYIRDV